MTDSIRDQIERLLREGLDHYGADEDGPAILLWEKVLELDPANVEAKDYLDAADRRSSAGSKRGGAASSIVDLLEEAKERIRAEDYEGALGFLGSGEPEGRRGLEIQATVELVRSRLLDRYRERVGSLESIPELRADAATITKFNLPSDAGFVLSLVDGSTSVADMISVSGLDPFDAWRILGGLIDTEIVSMRV